MKFKKAMINAASVLFLVSCGNGGSFDPSKNISITVREDGSGTKSAFLEILGLKGASDPAGAITATGTAAVLQEVSSNKYAIAYDSLGYVDDTVKKLNVDGVEPTKATIKDGSYAISRPLNVIYKESSIDASPMYKDYLGFLSSKAVQDLIDEEGYVSLIDDAKAYSATVSYTGSIAISGSTSLQPLMIKIAAEYMKLQPDVDVQVSGGGSGTGYSNAEKDVSIFGMISESFSSSKASSCTYYTVCKDGIAVIVNKENTLDNISKADLSTIYNPDAASPISTWSSLIK